VEILAAPSNILGKVHRLTASLLLLVMMFPVLAPFALASSTQSEGMHCKRMPLADAPADTAPRAPDSAMHCHHAASQQASPDSETLSSATTPPDSFRASDCCCGRGCDCCRNSKTSTWARPTVNNLAVLSLIVKAAAPVANFSCGSAVFLAPDSARAPPRS